MTVFIFSEKFFVTKFVTRITKFVTCVSNFVTAATKFVTKTFCAEGKKYQVDSKKLLRARERQERNAKCLFLILLDTFCSYYLKR